MADIIKINSINVKKCNIMIVINILKILSNHYDLFYLLLLWSFFNCCYPFYSLSAAYLADYILKIPLQILGSYVIKPVTPIN
jgi:hypothetical protein